MFRLADLITGRVPNNVLTNNSKSKKRIKAQSLVASVPTDFGFRRRRLSQRKNPQERQQENPGHVVRGNGRRGIVIAFLYLICLCMYTTRTRGRR